MQNRILFIITSHNKLGDTGRATGFYYEEVAVPYWLFVEHGFEVDFASIQGGLAPHDPKSLVDMSPSVSRFVHDREAMIKIEDTMAIDEVNIEQYDAIYIPGGHGTMWDFPNNAHLAAVISDAYFKNLVIGTVCHGAVAFVDAVKPDGEPLLKGLKVNGFTNEEEVAVELDKVVPFLLEDRLKELGATFEKSQKFEPYMVEDGNIITGQNPASSNVVAKMILKKVQEKANA